MAELTNWLGQYFYPGVAVCRGARDGNTSTFKIGVVQKVTGTKVSVKWMFEPNYAYKIREGEPVYQSVKSTGASEVDTLFTLDDGSIAHPEITKALDAEIARVLSK
ncbi:hypothetical protein SEA_KUDEFRE_112 [Gordonia phage Kudefre]|uniref:Uncharacterized protein n=2 Tax=Octobienvirus TaxID=3044779 RepID=A0AAE8Y6D4_9CAUD|nr:hypothetical protein L3Y22_gp136 [Gordonia phage Octobien14]YP_010246625.1 hypothetical protein L3Y24_gp131 [Gordonia phage Kudefre]AYR03245.1 hypothetical protein SEA_OCTOBIEN14_108 [Gordonia phage Octobien14]UDL15330.1 hypothetical protein SEA_KUDEFRE_112 [Gordonia phage Kudefre]